MEHPRGTTLHLWLLPQQPQQLPGAGGRGQAGGWAAGARGGGGGEGPSWQAAAVEATRAAVGGRGWGGGLCRAGASTCVAPPRNVAPHCPVPLTQRDAAAERVAQRWRRLPSTSEAAAPSGPQRSGPAPSAARTAGRPPRSKPPAGPTTKPPPRARAGAGPAPSAAASSPCSPSLSRREVRALAEPEALCTATSQPSAAQRQHEGDSVAAGPTAQGRRKDEACAASESEAGGQPPASQLPPQEPAAQLREGPEAAPAASGGEAAGAVTAAPVDQVAASSGPLEEAQAAGAVEAVAAVAAVLAGTPRGRLRECLEGALSSVREGGSFLMREACPGERSYVGRLRVAGARATRRGGVEPRARTDDAPLPEVAGAQ
jgi:hypothetical protein